MSSETATLGTLEPDELGQVHGGATLGAFDRGRWAAASRRCDLGVPRSVGDSSATMDQALDPYQIRLARPDEIDRVREIEDESGAMFNGTGLIDESLDVSFPLDDLRHLVGAGQVWVACRRDDVPVGMVIASIREGAVYVEEMDVLPAHARQGLGTRLLTTVVEWAQARGHSAVTLSTFRDLPWNGPFYRRNGFRDLEPTEWTPGMRRIRAKEARHGLRVEARVFMRRDLRGGSSI